MSIINPDTPSAVLPDASGLQAQGVSFHYGADRPAVNNVSARFSAGELTMIVGPNGSGKSTLLQLLLGHLVPAAGHVAINGRHVTQLHALERAALISYVPQSPHVSFAYSVHQIVAMGRWASRQCRASAMAICANVGGSSQSSTAGVSPDQLDNDLIRRTMWDLDIHALADRTYDELSTGERQRVALARAIVQDAPIMLLDEPTAALDIWHQLELLDHLKLLTRQKQKTVIWVTHDLNHARTNADRVLVMHAGQAAAQGKPPAVLTPEILEPIYRVRVEIKNDMLWFSRSNRVS